MNIADIFRDHGEQYLAMTIEERKDVKQRLMNIFEDYPTLLDDVEAAQKIIIKLEERETIPVGYTSLGLRKLIEEAHEAILNEANDLRALALKIKRELPTTRIRLAELEAIAEPSNEEQAEIEALQSLIADLEEMATEDGKVLVETLRNRQVAEGIILIDVTVRDQLHNLV